MPETNAREEQLLRMVGEERDEHPEKAVAAAERELARRAGGTRRQAVRRIRRAGLLVVLLGLLIGGVAWVAYAAVVTVLGPQRGLSGATVVPAAIALLALLAIGLGAAVLARIRSVLAAASLIPFLWPGDVRVAAYRPDTAGLLRLIGQARRLSAPEAVQQAEDQLQERLTAGREDLKARLKSWGGSAAALAVLMVINSGGIIMMVLLLDVLGAMAPGTVPPQMAQGVNLTLMWVVALVHGAFGLALLVGGLALRAHTDWGRRLVVWSLWISFGAAVAAGLASAPSTIARRGPTELVVLAMAGGVVFDAAWLALCWWVTRVLGRPEVREACGVELPPPVGLR